MSYDTWKSTEPEPEDENEQPRTLEQERDDFLEQREREQAASSGWHPRGWPAGFEIDAGLNEFLARYRGYEIRRASSYAPYRWEFAHADYDGAPEHSYGPPADNRCGHEQTLADCVREIDQQIEEGIE